MKIITKLCDFDVWEIVSDSVALDTGQVINQ